MLVVEAADARDMPHGDGSARFAVHFDRNSFGWGGKGALIATRAALSFTARRAGWLGYLLPRDSLQVSAREITSVLREGHVVRLQFQRRSDAAAAHVELAAANDRLAADLVGYLPTAHAIEMEKPPQPRTQVHLSSDLAKWILALGIGASSLAAVVLVWNQDRFPEALPAAASPVASPVLPSQPVFEAAAIPASQLLVSRSELRSAEERTAAMKRKFALELRDLMEGKITQANFALRLNRDLIPQWRQERGELSNRFDRISTQLSVLDLLKRSADLWTQALALYSEGLREQRPSKVLQAFKIMGQAEALEASAYDLVGRAEKRDASAASGQP